MAWTAEPLSFSVPAAGMLVILTAASALAGESLGSVKPKSAASSVRGVSSLMVSVAEVPIGASLIGPTLISKEKEVMSPSLRTL